jgi:hypothetical protein
MKKKEKQRKRGKETKLYPYAALGCWVSYLLARHTGLAIEF